MSHSPSSVRRQAGLVLIILTLGMTTVSVAQKPGGGTGSDTGGCFWGCKEATALERTVMQMSTTVQTPAFELHANYPNPFNPTTTIRYTLARQGQIDVKVYNAAGRVVQILATGHQPAGLYQVQWDSRNANGSVVPSGMYFVRVEMGGFVQTRKMILQK